MNFENLKCSLKIMTNLSLSSISIKTELRVLENYVEIGNFNSLSMD
jgi:hypothetical protein